MCLHIFSQKVGVTATLPNEVPSQLQSGPHEWYYRWSSLWHNGNKISTDLPFIDDLKHHQTVGLLLTSDGQLHIYHDGRHTKKVATNLPVNHHLWGAVDVYGHCTKIKSELLSGELDGVFMYLYFIGEREQANLVVRTGEFSVYISDGLCTYRNTRHLILRTLVQFCI